MHSGESIFLFFWKRYFLTYSAKNDCFEDLRIEWKQNSWLHLAFICHTLHDLNSLHENQISNRLRIQRIVKEIQQKPMCQRKNVRTHSHSQNYNISLIVKLARSSDHWIVRFVMYFYSPSTSDKDMQIRRRRCCLYVVVVFVVVLNVYCIL